MTGPASRPAYLFALTASATLLLFAVGWFRTGGWYFSLDDPYIHLAFAEQLARGHLGASPGITSVPVSSPIWPALLLPGALVGAGLPGMFLVVFACQGLVVWASWKAAESIDAPTFSTALLFVLVGNAIPLTVVGMEHLLHVALAIAAAAAVIRLDRGPVPWWGLLAVTLMPLVRFEGLGMAGLVALYAAYRGDRRVLGALGLGLLGLAGFCAGVYAATGHVLPGSVLSKLSSIPAAWQSPEHPWSLALWLVVLLGLLPLGGRPDLAAMASIVAMGHLVFGRASNHDRYVPYALAIGAVWLWASYHTPSERREPASRMVKTIVVLLLTLVHIPAWVAQPVMILRTHAMHGVLADLRSAADAPVGTHDIGMASRGSAMPVVDLLGLSNVPILNGWLEGDAVPVMVSEMNRHEAHLAMGVDSFFGVAPPGWVLVATLEPLPAYSEDLVKTLSVYATSPQRVPWVREVVEGAGIEDRRRIVFEAESAP